MDLCAFRWLTKIHGEKIIPSYTKMLLRNLQVAP